MRRGAGPVLQFRVRTRAFGGRYAPLNIVGIWVERADGGYVKTLERWAGVCIQFLRTWQRISAGDLTDAITSATRRVHQVQEVRWNFTDVSGATVPDGDYKLGLETTDRDVSGALHYFSFVKGSGPQPTPAPSPQFVSLGCPSSSGRRRAYQGRPARRPRRSGLDPLVRPARSRSQRVRTRRSGSTSRPA
jgi:hypothetical protein